MQLLAFLPAVTAGLPRVHRTPVSGCGRGTTGLGQAAVPVLQQRPRQGGLAQIQHREDEQLVPEDMAAVCLAVQSARRHSHVEVGGVAGNGLQQVQQMEPHDS